MSAIEKSSTEIPQNSTQQIFQSDFICIGRIKFQKRKKIFYNKKSSSVVEDTSDPATRETVNVIVYSIRLNRLMRTDEANMKTRELVRKYLHLDRINDLIHSVVALYDNSLPDIGIQYIYDCICSRKAYTICIFRELDTSLVDSDVNTVEVEYDEDTDCLESIDNEAPKSIFHKLFHANSSSESSSSGSEEDEADENDDAKSSSNNEEDFTIGIKTFLEKYRKSNENNKENFKNPLTRLLACTTLERVNTFQYPGQDEWVILLQLMAVLKSHRGYGIGKYLMANIIQNVQLVGPFDAIITSSDANAIEFYEKYGFNDNPIMNSKYKSIGDIWTNTTKMCYVPPYMIKTIMKKKTSIELNSLEELTQIENDFKKWNKITLTSYQINSQIFLKLKQEIIGLKAKNCAQENLINDLQVRNEILERKNRLLNLQLKNSKKNSVDDNEETSEVKSEENASPTETVNTPEDSEIDKLISELKQMAGTKFGGQRDEDRIIKQFKNSLKKSELKYNIEIKSIKTNKDLKKEFLKEYEAFKNSLFSEVNEDASENTTLISELYVSKISSPDGIEVKDFYNEILQHGLGDKHCIKNNFNLNGVYLSRYANVEKMHGFVLLVEAIISNCFTVTKDNEDFNEKLLMNYQSLLVLDSNFDNYKENEYFLMNPKHILPLAVIEYELMQS